MCTVWKTYVTLLQHLKSSSLPFLEELNELAYVKDDTNDKVIRGDVRPFPTISTYYGADVGAHYNPRRNTIGK